MLLNAQDAMIIKNDYAYKQVTNTPRASYLPMRLSMTPKRRNSLLPDSLSENISPNESVEPPQDSTSPKERLPELDSLDLSSIPNFPTTDELPISASMQSTPVFRRSVMDGSFTPSAAARNSMNETFSLTQLSIDPATPVHLSAYVYVLSLM